MRLPVLLDTLPEILESDFSNTVQSPLAAEGHDIYQRQTLRSCREINECIGVTPRTSFFEEGTPAALLRWVAGVGPDQSDEKLRRRT